MREKSPKRLIKDNIIVVQRVDIEKQSFFGRYDT